MPSFELPPRPPDELTLGEYLEAMRRAERERIEAERDLREGRIFGVWFLRMVSTQDEYEAGWWPAGL